MSQNISTSSNVFDEAFNRLRVEAKNYPILTFEEEQELFKQYKAGSRLAGQKIIRSHLRMVVSMAAKYKGYGLPLSEIAAEGNYGLAKALTQFDPSMGNRFATYAMWWIRSMTHKYVAENWSMVRFVTSAPRKKLFFGLRRAKFEIGAAGPLTQEQAEDIATVMEVPVKDVLEMDQRLIAADASLNIRMGGDNDGGEILNLQADDSPLQDESFEELQKAEYRRNLIANGMETLTERERTIIEKRHLSDEPANLQDLAEIYQVSRERIRQIEERALKKLKKNISSIMHDQEMKQIMAKEDFAIVPAK